MSCGIPGFRAVAVTRSTTASRTQLSWGLYQLDGRCASVFRHGKDFASALRWFWCSRVHCQEHITVVAKRFRCTEVLLQLKTYGLTDRNFFTVGGKRFRHAVLLVFVTTLGSNRLRILPARSRTESSSLLAPKVSTQELYPSLFHGDISQQNSRHIFPILHEAWR